MQKYLITIFFSRFLFFGTFLDRIPIFVILGLASLLMVSVLPLENMNTLVKKVMSYTQVLIKKTHTHKNKLCLLIITF